MGRHHATSSRSRFVAGAVSFEALFVLPLLFGLVFVYAGLSLSLYRRMRLEASLVAAARSSFIVPAGSTVSPADVKAAAVARAAAQGLSISAADLRVCPVTAPSCSVESVGVRGSLFLLSLNRGPGVSMKPITILGVHR